jgi:hypothetical protein
MDSKRRDRMDNGAPVPEGIDFFKLVWGQEHQCEKETDKRIGSMGTKAPKCFESLGTVLSLLDRLASCWWQCRGTDHILEYLTGRCVGSAGASIRLMRLGFYDETLALVRNIGEVVNLFALFVAEPASYNEWRDADEQKRRHSFSPVKVRLRLQYLNAPIPIGQETYRGLCEVGTHVTPSTRPQSHNPLGVPVIGGRFQEAGVLMALNELARSISFLAIYAPVLVKADVEVRGTIWRAGRTLAGSIGGVTVGTLPEYWKTLRDSSAL